MSWNHPIKRRGVTGTETILMFVALIISAAAFSFLILNTGIIIKEKTMEITPAGLEEDTTPAPEYNLSVTDEDFVIDRYDTEDGSSSQLSVIELIEYIIHTTDKLGGFWDQYGE